jgi:hypothetical protein
MSTKFIVLDSSENDELLLQKKKRRVRLAVFLVWVPLLILAIIVLYAESGSKSLESSVP